MIDDDPMFVDILHRVAAPFDLAPSDAATAQTAIEAIGRRDFDVIFLDLHLAGGNSSSVVEYIRRVKPHLLPRVIAVTSHPGRARQVAPDVPVVDKGNIETLRQRVAQLL